MHDPENDGPNRTAGKWTTSRPTANRPIEQLKVPLELTLLEVASTQWKQTEWWTEPIAVPYSLMWSVNMVVSHENMQNTVSWMYVHKTMAFCQHFVLVPLIFHQDHCFMVTEHYVVSRYFAVIHRCLVFHTWQQFIVVDRYSHMRHLTGAFWRWCRLLTSTGRVVSETVLVIFIA